LTTEDDDASDRTILISRRSVPDGGPGADAIGHYLSLIEGDTPGRRVEITAAGPVTIGRLAGQTLVFADHELSRRHARLSLIIDKVIVEDLGSTNGTFVSGERIARPSAIEDGTVLRIGSQTFRYERRSRRDIERADDLTHDLLKASRYVHSLLPQPITTGPIRANWQFVPSTELGGDAFGYYWLTPDVFVFYLVDVSGHGVGSAMHSVSVLNVLRQRALPNVDFADPASVLASLNRRFPMSDHGGLFFTMWYGVFHAADRTLVCGSAGHHPAFLVPPDRSAAQPIGTPALMIGVMPDGPYESCRSTVPPGSSLYLFSDGAFEIVTATDHRWTLSDFTPLLLEPSDPAVEEPDRIYRSIRAAARPGPLDDDLSLLVLTFE
jgi:serine phosphatase RsbU (regulator of sigma subunit)